MKRVAAYCRVSTDKDDQINSLESQKRYFEEYIQRNPNWQLHEIYVDEGITGTSTKKRHAFNRMIADALSKQFDFILTKEISRFARNTLDSIYYTRRLKEQGVGVLFLRDNINTLDPDAELRLTIMSSIAQEESRKTSDRVKWGQKRRMEQGVVFGRDMLGYDVRGGKLFVNQDGAEIVRLIFHKFVMENKGAHVIARELREAGIPTCNYMKHWSNTVILRILRNEKYVGDLIQKKTITPNYLSHEKKYNLGEEEMVVLRDHHEPIVTRQLFDRAQAELIRRSPSEDKKSKHSNRYLFSGKLKCGFCGGSFVSRTKPRTDGSIYKAWRCYEAAIRGAPKVDNCGNTVGCNGRQISHGDLLLVMSKLMGLLEIDRTAIVRELAELIQSVLSEPDRPNTPQLQDKLKQLEHKKQLLIELLLNEEIDKQDFQCMAAKYDKALDVAREELAQLAKTQKIDRHETPDSLILYMWDLLDGGALDEAFYRNLLDRMVIYDRNRMDIYLHCICETIHCTIA